MLSTYKAILKYAPRVTLKLVRKWSEQHVCSVKMRINALCAKY